MMVLLRAALRVAGEEPPADSAAVLERAVQVTGLSVDGFRVALAHARGERRLAGEAAVDAAAAYLDAVAALAGWVDAQVIP